MTTSEAPKTALEIMATVPDGRSRVGKAYDGLADRVLNVSPSWVRLLTLNGLRAPGDGVKFILNELADRTFFRVDGQPGSHIAESTLTLLQGEITRKEELLTLQQSVAVLAAGVAGLEIQKQERETLEALRSTTKGAFERQSKQ